MLNLFHCSYGQNPLYTEILIWDEGDGFAKEDIPHLFKRFYRGKNADAGGNIRGSGIGIGLALSKEIIEHQNGTIRAKNLPNGGACFIISFDNAKPIPMPLLRILSPTLAFCPR